MKSVNTEIANRLIGAKVHYTTPNRHLVRSIAQLKESKKQFEKFLKQNLIQHKDFST